MITHDQQLQYSLFASSPEMENTYIDLREGIKLVLLRTEFGRILVSREVQNIRRGALVQLVELPHSLRSILKDLDAIDEADRELEAAESLLVSYESRGYVILSH